jgi:hypothetical protein
MKITKNPNSNLVSKTRIPQKNDVSNIKNENKKIKIEKDSGIDKLTDDIMNRLKSGEISPVEATDELINKIIKLSGIEDTEDMRGFLLDHIKEDPNLRMMAQNIGLDIENLNT